jgi:hypothetical protein
MTLNDNEYTWPGYSTDYQLRLHAFSDFDGFADINALQYSAAEHVIMPCSQEFFRRKRGARSSNKKLKQAAMTTATMATTSAIPNEEADERTSLLGGQEKKKKIDQAVEGKSKTNFFILLALGIVAVLFVGLLIFENESSSDSSSSSDKTSSFSALNEYGSFGEK